MTARPAPWTGDPAAYLARTASRLDEHEARVRAFTHLDRSVLTAGPVVSNGPLAGMPIAVKEIIDVAGMPTTFGSPTATPRASPGYARRAPRCSA